MATKSNGKKYKCPYCDYKNYRSKLIDHVDEEHEDMIPKGYTASRVVYNSINKKDHGTCMICHKETKWDENKQRYDTLCKNPKCKKQYVEIVRSRMVHKYGTYNLLKDPNFQKKMLEGRSISGKYKFADGGSVGYVGSYEKKFLEFMDVFLHVKSYDIISPGPNIPYTYKGQEHVWITDFLYEPYNLVFDIKDGGNNPNRRDMKEYREKQLAKEKAITEYGDYNYIRLTDNKFEQLILLMMELKDKVDKKSIIRINESFINEEARIDDDKLPKFIYHISYINHDGETFEPRVYDNDNVKNGMERRVKRVCFSDSITRALYSIFPNGAYDADFYVHVPDSKCKVYKTTTDDIYDSDITHELWIKEPVKMKCIGKIHVSGVSDKTHTIEVDKDKAGYGKKKYHETKWRWIEKYEEDKTLYESVNESHIISSKEDNNMVNEFVSNKVIDDFESKQDMYLSHFTKMGLNVSFIQVYKQEYPSLSHIRINSNTKGCVWIDDKKNLVAIINTEKKDDDYVWINAFEIFGKYKGHGLSKQILKYAIKEYEITHLSVNKNNEVAYQLYKKLGFKTYNTTEKMYFMKLKSLNESYIEESSTNRSLYHLSQSNLDGKTLQPRIPSNFLVKNGYEDGKTERVCFAKSIDGSLRGMSQNLKGMKLYVHIPDGNYNIYNPTTKQVPDCKITSEVWIKEPVKLKCIGQIEVIKDKGEDGIPYKYGNNTAELYDWDWKWIDKINESSNILTQRINESADKSKLNKNFKKKSGIKFKYIDIKSNKSKVDKYLSEDKSYQNTYKKYLNDISGEIVIDEENDILAGYVFVIDKFITPVFVVGKYRGYGLGDALVKDAVSKYGAKRLWVYKDNEVAINLYKKYGFKTYIEDEEPSILMATDKKYAQDIKY